MHSRAKGKSGSKKPLKKTPSWAPYKGKEVEKLIVKYSKGGKTASETGIILRDNYGIHSVRSLTGKKISTVLSENKLGRGLPEDLLNLIKKMVAIKRHREKNKQDQTAKRGELLTSSKIRRLIKHYKSSGKLPAEWGLDMDRLKIYLE